MRGYTVCVGIFCLCIAGCITVVADHFTIDDPNLESAPLKLDGYYYHLVPHFSADPSLGKAIDPILLWRDGTAAYVGRSGRRLNDSEIGPTRYGTLENAHGDFQRFINDPQLFDRTINGGIRWGKFRVGEDSLLLQVFRLSFGTIPRSYDVSEYKGRILSDTSFVLDEVRLYGPPHRGASGAMSDTFYFRHVEEKPSSMNWTQTHPDLQ
ncbi:MAG: hypothetical protein AAGI91_06760 [Bacteroidota bacterium]